MKTIKENIVLKNNWYDIFNNDIEFSDGSPGTYIKLVAKNEGGASVLPITEDGKIVLVKSFKYAIAQPLIELPQGLRNPDDELISDTAHRELFEETSYVADVLTFVDVTRDSSNIMTGSCSNFIGWGCRLSDVVVEPDPREEVEAVLLFSPMEVQRLVMGGFIEDSATARLVLRFLQELSPVSAANIDGESSAFIHGVFCSKHHSMHFNPFIDREEFHKEFADWNRGWAYSKDVIQRLVPR